MPDRVYSRRLMHAAQLEHTIAQHFGSAEVTAVYLFGSQARGTAGAHSDVDLGVLYPSTPPSTLEAQPFLDEADLAEQLGLPVQIIVMNTAPVDLVHRILADGRLLVEHDRSHRIRFEVRARNEYFDLLPTLLRYRRTGS